MKWFALIAAPMLLVASTAWARVTLQADAQRYSVQGMREVRVDFPVGELTVEGDDGDDVRVSVRVRCRHGDADDCERRARRVRIEHSVEGGVLHLEFRGTPKMSTRGISVEAHFLVPRALATRIEMGVGDLNLSGLSGNLAVELGVGDLDIHGDSADFNAVNAEVGVGDASLRSASGRVQGNGFIGRELNWRDGRGPARIRAHVGVGDVNVVLR